MARGYDRACPVCFSPKGKRCTAPTDFGRRNVEWIHFKREEEEEGDA